MGYGDGRFSTYCQSPMAPGNESGHHVKIIAPVYTTWNCQKPVDVALLKNRKVEREMKEMIGI